MNGAQVLVAQWAEVGIKVEVQTVDLATLMTIAGSTDYQHKSVRRIPCFKANPLAYAFSDMSQFCTLLKKPYALG